MEERNMAGLTTEEAREGVERRAAGCLAVAVCALAAVAGLALWVGACRSEPRPGPESLAANIRDGIYGDELCGEEGRHAGRR